jgi:CBS-domain-containing membrane protein
MKSLIKAVALAAVLAVPAVSFAQSQSENGPVTRAEVRGELAQLEAVGYNPQANDHTYPDQIQAAEARVHAQNEQTSGYGSATGGSSQSGGATDTSVSSYSAPVRVYNSH